MADAPDAASGGPPVETAADDAGEAPVVTGMARFRAISAQARGTSLTPGGERTFKIITGRST